MATLGEAMAGSRERHMETMLQGSAFLQAIAHWGADQSGTTGEMPYPVAVAIAAASNGVALQPGLAAIL
uniref:urease accessory UreF family protein n=1 Tax=Klebsiella pneumoniae TaxID=573 RepID=UPI001D0E4A05